MLSCVFGCLNSWLLIDTSVSILNRIKCHIDILKQLRSVAICECTVIKTEPH